MPRRSKKSINVSVATLGEALRVYELPAGSTVKDALAAAGITETGEARVDAASATPSTVLKHGQIVTMVPKVQGG